MKKEIREFCLEHDIKMPEPRGGKEYSDLYVDIYDKYKHERDEWNEISSDGKTLLHCLLLYEEKDLKEYFKIGAKK